jgi:hypothetical protein
VFGITKALCNILASFPKRTTSAPDMMMWEQGYPDLVRGIVDADPVPDDSSQRWGISIIARMPPASAPLFTDIRTTLRAWTGEEQTLYDASNLHTTIRSCEFYRSTIALGDAALMDYWHALREVAAQIPPLTMTYRGLSANRTGIIVQGFPQTEHVQHLRRLLHQRLEQLGRTHGPEAARIRRGAHVSLVVFAGPVLAPQSLARYIGDHRATDYGAVTTSSLELIRYRRTQRQVAIESLAHVVLAGQDLHGGSE